MYLSGGDTNVCADLTDASTENWPDGYSVEKNFWVDTWGDGSVQLSPQVLQWDDGNSNNGDGCSSSCEIEDKYSWVIQSQFGGKSYWVPSWGDGVYNITLEEWDDGNSINNDGCQSDCTITTGYKCIHYATDPWFWHPYWGDGIRDIISVTETCDDGNNMNFDGWDYTWQVEENYSCDNSTGIDVCTTIYTTPVPVSNKYDELTNTITVEFDQDMLEQPINETDIILYLDGPNGPYTATWEAEFSGNQFIVKFVPSPILIGGVGEWIQLQLAEIKAFKSNYSITMYSNQVYDFNVPMLPASASTKISGKGASYTFLLTLIVSLGVSLLTGGSMELMWSLANTLQLLFFLGLINLNYSSNLETAYTVMGYSNFDNPFTKYLTAATFSTVSFIKSPLSSKFDSLGYGSTNIVSNSFDKILMVVAFIAFAVLMTFLYAKCKKKSSWLAKKIVKIDESIRYESISRFSVELVLNLTVACLINIFYGDLTETQDYVAYVVAMLTLIGILFGFAYSIVYPMYYFENISGKKIYKSISNFDLEYPDYHERHCLLFLGFKKAQYKHMLFYAFFILRRMGVAIVIVCMKEFNKQQLILVSFMFFWMLVYAAVHKPYVDHLNNFLNIFNEWILVIYSITLFLFLDDGNPTKLEKAGWVWVGIIVVFFIVNWIIIFPIVIYTGIVSLKEKCCKKEKKNSKKVKSAKKSNKFNEAEPDEEISKSKNDEESKYDEIQIRRVYNKVTVYSFIVLIILKAKPATTSC